MRIERWYWIVVFCVISLFAHFSLKYVRASLVPSTRVTLGSTNLEVTLAPPDPVAPAPKAAEAKPTEAAPKPKTPEPKREEAVTTARATTAEHDINFHKAVDTQHVRLTSATQEEKALPDFKKVASDPVGVQDEDKITNEAPPAGLPNAPKSNLSPRIANNAPKSLTVPTEAAGGGSLAPDKTMTGENGAAGPENPVEDVVYTGGGAGGENLPKAPAKVGGGGGNSILSVENPLAKEAIPEDKPGLNSGTGGGAGTGGGGGIGSRIGRSNGTRQNGLDRIASLNSKPGNGLGAASGSGQGTKAPGGGKGTGAETPGTGGEGAGYGKGAGIDIGEGKAPHGEMAGLTRGIPFGDIIGLLGRGKPDGGGGGPGRGGVFGQAPTIGGGGGGGSIHIIYLLDTSGSMKDGGKIYKAEDALKRALVELRPTDTFNVMNFDSIVHVYSPDMLPATRENIKKAWQYIDNLGLNPYTNLSAGIDRALQEPTVSHIFILSDGEPHGGIEDFQQLKTFIRDRNKRKVQINTLALGLGERFPGMRLLRSIAEENDGKYSYVNLFNDTATPGK